jgi:16S rRNA (cytidine1402-2'-O)-methyltransferase
LTKLYETVTRGTLADLAANPAFAEPKGELVIVVGPGEAAAASEADLDRALAEALQRLAPGAAAAEVARAMGVPRKPLYARALALKAGG